MKITGYELLEKLSETGAASNWKARQTSMDRMVVVKIPDPGFVREENPIESFRSQAKVTAQLAHPGVVQLHDVGTSDEGIPYIVSEYVSGTSWADMLHEKGRLEEKEALDMVREVGEVLQFAWDRVRIIHGDLRPERFVKDEITGKAKVEDLGLVKLFGGANWNTDYKYVPGFPNYVAPEQVHGYKDLDPRTDIYSMGAILYHLLTGIIPFYRVAPKEIFEKQIHDHLPDLYERNRNVSPGMYWLIEKMMARDRMKRPTDWNALLDDIKAVEAGKLPAVVLAEGESTISRHEERPTKGASAGKKPGEGAKNGKVVKMRSDSTGQTRTMSVKQYTPKTFGRNKFIVLAVLLAAVVIFVYTQMKPPIDLENDTTMKTLPGGLKVRTGGPIDLGPRIELPDSAPEEPVRRSPPARVRQRPDVAVQPPQMIDPTQTEWTGDDPPRRPPTQTTTSQPRTWENDDYRDALAKLVQAEKLYQNYLRTRQNPGDLAQADVQCRIALELLTDVKSEAPPQVNIDNLMRKTNMLIYNIRRSKPVKL